MGGERKRENREKKKREMVRMWVIARVRQGDREKERKRRIERRDR